MDNHPIPQDITGFQFKLIGNMTVRQFGYLAAGAILAWVAYLLPLPFLIKLPLIIAFIVLGLAFAFLPVDGRPMDAMFINLIRALFNPTQYIYQKQGGNVLAPNYSMQQNPVISQPAQPPAPNNFQPAVLEQKKEEEEEMLEEQEEVLKQEASEVEQQSPNSQELMQVKEMLAETIRQKEELEKELLALRQNLNAQAAAPKANPKPIQTNPPLSQAPSQAVDTPKPEPAPIISSEPPNLVRGKITDPRENPLFNILVEVVDQDGNPVRAFKTNEQGKFSSATSLTNGSYTIKLEDPKEEHKFDDIRFEANGSVLEPFNIKSIDQREELRRELFN